MSNPQGGAPPSVAFTAASSTAGVTRPAPEVIAAVRASCLAVAQRPVRLAETFYAHLFEMAPHLRPMFPPDLTGQMQRMTDTLLGAIAQLETPDTAELEAALHRLGADHRTRLGVEPEHYGYIGHALTRAVRDVAGPGYSGSLSSAWIALCQWVVTHMTTGALAVEADASALRRPVIELPQPREPADPGAAHRLRDRPGGGD